MLPGLIDAHGHAGHCLIRTLVEQSTHWISMANEIYDRFTDDFFRYADGALAAAERLKFGITTGVSMMGSSSRCDRAELLDAHFEGSLKTGIRQFAGGSFGAILMNGVKRGLFSNEAGSGYAPCAAAAAEGKTPVTMGLVQSLGVFIDTIVICSCTAFIMLLVPQEVTDGLSGMALLQTAMEFHLGRFGVIFIAVTLAMFSFSTFLGILFYARSNVAYLFGDKWCWQTAYKVLALVMLFIGGIAAYTFVWDLGDVGIGLMTLFNISILVLTFFSAES